MVVHLTLVRWKGTRCCLPSGNPHLQRNFSALQTTPDRSLTFWICARRPTLVWFIMLWSREVVRALDNELPVSLREPCQKILSVPRRHGDLQYLLHIHFPEVFLKPMNIPSTRFIQEVRDSVKPTFSFCSDPSSTDCVNSQSDNCRGVSMKKTTPRINITSGYQVERKLPDHYPDPGPMVEEVKGLLRTSEEFRVAHCLAWGSFKWTV